MHEVLCVYTCKYEYIHSNVCIQREKNRNAKFAKYNTTAPPSGFSDNFYNVPCLQKYL